MVASGPQLAPLEIPGLRPAGECDDPILDLREMGPDVAALAEMTGPAEAGPVVLISDCALPTLLQAIFSRHRVFEEILVLRCEAFRKLENLKAVAIADGPELDIG